MPTINFPGVSILPPAAASPVWDFFDDLTSGDLTHSEGGVSYAGSAETTVVQYDNRYAIKFNDPSGYGGSTVDWFAEQRMNITQCSSIEIQFDMHIPSNYAHRNVDPENNKLLAVYAQPYNDPGFNVVASTRRGDDDGESFVHITVHDSGVESVLTNELGDDIIDTVDHGTWITLKFIIECESSNGAGDGRFSIWKNGVARTDANTVGINIFGDQNRNYIDGLYLIGWANSGFANDTTFHITNIGINRNP